MKTLLGWFGKIAMTRTLTMTRIVAVTLGVPLIAATPYSSLKWRSIGPATAGGRVPAVAGTLQNAFLYYIGTAGGGVWKTENSGQTWTPVFNKEPVASIGAIAIDPTDQNSVWVGTGESNPRNDVIAGDGIYHSTDGGKTWRNMGLRQTRHIATIAIDPANPMHVVVAALGSNYSDSVHRGIYVTFDGGRTWSKTLYLAPDSGASDLAMDPKDPRVLYTGMWEFRRQPWTFSSGGPHGGLYKSTDGGRTWTQLQGSGLPSGLTGRIGLAIAPSNPDRVYALIQSRQGVLWRSDDAGAHWTKMFSGTLINQRPFYFSHLAVDPTDENRVYTLSMDLAMSTDGGKTFKRFGKEVHADTHAIWIDPNNGKRFIIGDDGGFALTLDRGKSFWFSRNLPIEQVYHVGISNENPYTVCAALQDNQAYCGPSNSRSTDGITGRDWFVTVGGDGMWSVPDPSNPRYVFADSEDGYIVRYDRRNESMRSVIPYEATSAARFDARLAKYRFNWNSPIAFAPWRPQILWYGGSVVFQSTDRGEHWSVISHDLTRNDKAHQAPSGGPITKDVFGTEYSDTILDIEGSPAAKGEIWVGTDDGLVQLTRDGGAHWTDVTPPGVPPWGRVETVAPSPLAAGTAYASIDRHRSGDRSPYLFVTTNYGKTWRKIVTGLPGDDFMRTVRPDVENPELVFAGTERGLYVSFDAGAHWNNFLNNIAPVSVRDLRIAPMDRDLVAGTHGRGVWILDDITALEHLTQAQQRGFMLFTPRTAYRWIEHSDQQGLYGRFSGENPPDGALLTFYQAAASRTAPAARFYDASGHLIRTLSRIHKVKGKTVSVIPNAAGINRFTWDLNAAPAVQWNGAAKPFRVHSGPPVPPGTYTVKLTADGHTATQHIVVKADPLSTWTQAQYEEAYRFNEQYVGVTSNIDTVLNTLDALQTKIVKAEKAAAGNSALLARLNAAEGRRKAVFAAFTANYRNGEDFALEAGSLREDLPAGLYFSPHPATAETRRFARDFNARYEAAMRLYHDFMTQTIAPLRVDLH
jgi:photosystem II stability/assembly factor-like uncharacterized protein